VTRAEAILGYAAAVQSSHRPEVSRLSWAEAEETAIAAITDFLHLFKAHGRDVDDMLDRARTRFESEQTTFRHGL
jgi:hypothetical protein